MRAFRLSESAPDPARDGRDVADEIRHHLELRTEELIARGLSPQEARRAAEAAFGDVSAVEAECRTLRARRTRHRRRLMWTGDLVTDLRFAIRTFRRAPLFALAAVLTLTLGMGAATAAFTLVNGVLLRPLPYGDPARLAMIWTTGEGVRGVEPQWPLSAPNYLDLKAEARSLASVTAFRFWPYTLAGEADGQHPELLAGSKVALEFFDVLGVRPLLGRTFTPTEAREGITGVVVISHDLWRRRFGGTADVVGRRITLSGERVTIIGVMPPGFAFPRGAELPAGLQFRPRTEVWTPLVFSAQDLALRGTNNLAAIARLRDGVALGGVRADLTRIATRLAADHPRVFSTRMGLDAVGLKEQASAPVRRGLLLLLGAVCLVLLVACANIANLLLARAAGRTREFAVRRALGATRARVLRQLVVENVLLALGGAAGGLAAAWAGTALLLARVPASLPRADDVRVDAHVVGVTLAVALVAGGLFALLTSAHVGREAGAAGAPGARATTGVAGRAGRRLLAGTEIALSLVLLVGAGLLLRSYARLQQVAPGFDAERAMTAGLLLPLGARFDPARDGPGWSAFFTAYAERLAAGPGVAAAGGVSSLPLSGAVETASFAIDGRPARTGEPPPSADYAVVTPGYFAAMRTPMLAGRTFDTRDGAATPRVIVVNAAFARRYWPAEPTRAALGRRVRLGFDDDLPHEIVGIAGDVRQTALDEPPTPAMYFPVTQMPYPFLTFVVRMQDGAGDAAAALTPMRQALRAMDASLALHDVQPLRAVLDASVARQRFSMRVAGAFAAAALVLAALGLYGVIAYGVALRTRELGVRMALGASRADVLVTVMREGVLVTAAGVLVGVGGALAAGRLLQRQLYAVSATDPAVYVAVALLIVVVALVASAVPARRAARLDPTAALRAE